MRSTIQLLFLVTLSLAVGCSPLPRKYIRDAVPNVTLSKLKASPQAYQDRLVVMGAVILEEEHRESSLWLHVRNRPLDQDYRPQLPPSADDPEGGWYWVVVGDHQKFPSSHHHWGDMVVVGRMTGLASGREPILKMVYVRGRGLQPEHDSAWEDLLDTNYIPYIPTEVIGETGRQ